MKKIYFLILFAFCFGQLKANEQLVPKIDENVNLKSFLSLHDLIWQKSPNDYFNAPFIGNGLLGAMIYQPDGEPLRLDIGRTDVVDHRNSEARSIVDNGRLPVGHFTFETNGGLQNLTGRLSLYDAEAILNAGYSLCREGCRKNVEFSFRVLRGTDAILVDYQMTEGLQGQWMFHPEASVLFRNPIEGRRHLNPVPELSVSDGINLCVQKRDAGGC